MTTEPGPARGSLRVRMLVSAALVLILFLGVIGLVLDNAFRQSAEQAVSERLLLHIYALIAVSDEEIAEAASSLYLPEELQEPGFNSLGTGLYGLVFDAGGRELWRSQSALDLNLGEATRDLVLAASDPGVVQFNRLAGLPEPLFVLTYRVIWQSSSDQKQREYLFVVLQDFGPYKMEVTSFRNSLWGWLIAGIVVLVGLQAAIMYWGLKPISELESDIKAIEAGKQDYLEGHYPREIAGVTRNLNLLLSGERQQRERYRTTLADLAHSLKTPLAILKAEAASPGKSVEAMARAMDEQVQRMNEIVSYQLERAVVRTSSLAKHAVDVQQVVMKLVGTLRQVYRDKDLVIVTEVHPGFFPGDERDFLELLGNLLDNACKYGRHEVRLFAGEVNGVLRLVVEDDGPGIEGADRERVLVRGTRLDTRESGQGIGLAVVTEIVHGYDGAIRIDASPLGGARVSVEFASPS